MVFKLPLELIVLIFEFLSPLETRSVTHTCKRFVCYMINLTGRIIDQCFFRDLELMGTMLFTRSVSEL